MFVLVRRGWHVSAAAGVGGVVGSVRVDRASGRLVVVASVPGVGGLLLVVIATGPAVVVVFDPGALAVGEAMLRLTARSGTESVELGGQLGLRLDEAATVITHWLVSRIWILRSDCDNGGDQDNDEQYSRENSVVDEENDTHDTSDNSL